jgi:hypothetical protein
MVAESMKTFRFPLSVFVSPSMPFQTARRLQLRRGLVSGPQRANQQVHPGRSPCNQRLVLAGRGARDLFYLGSRETNTAHDLEAPEGLGIECPLIHPSACDASSRLPGSLSTDGKSSPVSRIKVALLAADVILTMGFRGKEVSTISQPFLLLVVRR